MFDAAADKQKKLQEKRRLEAKKKLQEQEARKKKEEEISKAQEERELALAREQRKREENREQRIYETGGIDYSATLRVIPSARIDDKVILPQSVFEALNSQGVYDVSRSGVITFEVCVSGGSSSSTAIPAGPSPSKVQRTESDQSSPDSNSLECPLITQTKVTHCGVAEFSAEEGTIMFGPKVLFSLQNRSREVIERVNIRYKQLSKYKESKCTFQPKGAGFFDDESMLDTVNLDLRSILEAQLQFHTCLTEGDVIPVRDPEGQKTYYLEAKVLEPDEALLLINTDMSIDILPSENVEYLEKLKKRREDQARRKAERQNAEEQRRRQWMEEFDVRRKADVQQAPNEYLEIQVRLPAGSTLSQKFHRSNGKMEEVFDFVENIPATIQWFFDKEAKYELVQSWPGHYRAFVPTAETKNQTLKEAGLSAKREQLFFKDKSSGAEYGDDASKTKASNDDSMPAQRDSQGSLAAPVVPSMPIEWRGVGDLAYQQMDAETLPVLGDEPMPDASAGSSSTPADGSGNPEEGASPGGKSFDSVVIFNMIQGAPGFREKGHGPQEAAQWAQKWGAQLVQLQELGYGPEVWITQAIPFLEKWNGTMHRVVNSLMEAGE